jgi:hypothetical protein
MSNRPMSALGHVCGRRLGKNFLTLLQHWSGSVMCAACLAARIGSQSKTRTLKCADPNGFSGSPDRPCLHYVVVSSPIPSKPQTPSRCLASPPSISLASTQPPYSTSMPQRGRRPQHQKQTCALQEPIADYGGAAKQPSGHKQMSHLLSSFVSTVSQLWKWRAYHPERHYMRGPVQSGVRSNLISAAMPIRSSIFFILRGQKERARRWGHHRP